MAGNGQAAERDYQFDNIRLLLIFFVVFGHLLESFAIGSLLYRFIYSFHMPVFIFINGYFDAILSVKNRSFAHIRQFPVFCDRINAVSHDLAQKNVFIRIEPFFDNGHHILAGYANVTLFSHINTSL